MKPKFLILDDVESAIGQLTELGHAVVGPVARSIRESILLFAAVHGWPVVRHTSFVEWAVCQQENQCFTLVLDPLLSPRAIGVRGVSVRVTRFATPDGLKIDAELPAQTRAALAGAHVTVLDDVAATGMTLRWVSELVRQVGGTVSRFVLCASTDDARSKFSQRAPVAAWSAFVAGDFQTVHLRDACPFLPFGGKEVLGRRRINTPAGVVPISTPVTVFRGGPWAQLSIDSNLRHTIGAGTRLVARRLSAALGRPATVTDVPLLGRDVKLTLGASRTANQSTSLDEIIA